MPFVITALFIVTYVIASVLIFVWWGDSRKQRYVFVFYLLLTILIMLIGTLWMSGGF